MPCPPWRPCGRPTRRRISPGWWRPRTRPLLSGHPALNEVWVAPRLRPAELFLRVQPGRPAPACPQLRARPFDLVVDLQGLIKSAVWVALARSPRKVGYDQTRELSYLALTERVEPFDPEAHAVRRYLNLAHIWGPPCPAPLPPGPGRGRGYFSPDPGETGRPLAVLHPGARWSSKLWPAASWAHLAEWLRDQGLPGGRHREPRRPGVGRGAWSAQCRAPLLNLAGRTSLAQLAAIFRKARLAVTTDTGAMHLAAALGTPVVALFGPTAPWRTGPFGDGHLVVRLGLPCSPCFKRRCPEPRCLTDLTPEVVEGRVRENLVSYGT